jgi:hypothetical protein
MRIQNLKTLTSPPPSSSPLQEEERERLPNPKNPKSPYSSSLLEEEKERVRGRGDLRELREHIITNFPGGI